MHMPWLSSKQLFIFISIVLLCCIPLLTLFHPGLPKTHDGPDHVIRTANYYQNFLDGNIIPRWTPNVNSGFGHPALMFFYPLPYYLGSFFHFLGFSFIDSVKIVFALSFLASGFTMYLWIRAFLGIRPAILAAFLYMFAPYRFVDLYVRGAIGEHVAFVFPPLVFYFFLQLSKKVTYGRFLGAVLSLAGLILSHNAISLMFLPILLVYGCYLLWSVKDRVRIAGIFIASIVFAFGVSAFFWIGAFFESKYTLVDFVTKDGDYALSFVEPIKWLTSPWSYEGTGKLSVEIGWVQLLLMLGGGIYLFFARKTVKNRLFAIGICLIFLIALFLMTRSSTLLWETLPILYKFQFPWRFLTVVVFATAVFGGLVLAQIPQKKQLLFLCVLVTVAILFTSQYWQAKSFVTKGDAYFSGIVRTTTNDTGESSPIWSTRSMEIPRVKPMEVIEGNAIVTQTWRSSTNHVYTVSAKKATRLVENTLYFPGWEIQVDNTVVPLQFQDPKYRGLMTFSVTPGVHTVVVQFSETKLRSLANTITMISCVALFVGYFLVRKIKKVFVS
jgi:uncharacterized membrane protein